MALEDLPDGFTVPTRGEIRDQFQRDVVFRQPGAPTGDGSQAFIDGSVLADALSPLYANAISIARGANLEDMTREQLKAECRALGIPEELPASGSTGFVIITASSGGVTIAAGRELKDESRNLRFKCARTGTYFNNKAVPVIAIDTGPTTNIPASTRLKWTNPPPGLGNIATVQADAEGNGLTGGRTAESDEDIRARIKTERKSASVGGNAAQIRKLVKDAGKALGIAVQECFVYPAIHGPGTYAYVFTLRPGSVGTSRIPSEVEIALVRAYLAKALPEDDGIFAAEILEQEVDAKIGVRWAANAEGWVDAQPWPAAADGWAVTAVTSATSFTVDATALDGIATPSSLPQAGKTFAFFDASNSTFARKRILTATATGVGNAYAIVIDDTNDASDLAYTPSVNEAFCPYSPSLDLLVEPLLTEVDKLGPGEMFDDVDFFDEGYRQKRLPENPLEWESELLNNSLDGVDALAQVHDVEWISPDVPLATNPGVAGASVNIIIISSLLAFAI